MLKQGIPMYKVKDFKGEEIKGNFYTSELQKVEKDETSLWFIDKILKKRTRGKKVQYFVSWSGFPSTLIIVPVVKPTVVFLRQPFSEIGFRSSLPVLLWKSFSLYAQ